MQRIIFLLGAIAGDLIGSYYEFHPTKDLNFPLFHPESRFTDDTVMTMATAQWILTQDNLPSLMQEYGNRYPDAGYGRGFQKWLTSKNPRPYNSFGNGSAMRISLSDGLSRLWKKRYGQPAKMPVSPIIIPRHQRGTSHCRLHLSGAYRTFQRTN